MNRSNLFLKDYKINKELNIERLVKEYSEYVYTIIQNISKENLKKEDIEEIISDTFYILWKNSNKLDNNTKIGTYLAGIVKNLLKEKVKKMKNTLNIEDYENTLAYKNDIYETYENRNKIKLIEKSLENMKEEEKQIFKLYYYYGKKIKQIAKKLNITEFNVKTKLFRIRKKIKKDLMKGGYRYE